MPDRVVDQIAVWREQLINLSRNNRLLYFKETNSTLSVSSPGPQELLDRISTQRGISFWEPLEEPDHKEASEQGLLEGIDSSGLSPARSSQAEDRRGAIVTEVNSRQKLRRTLTGLERRAAQEYMDRGLSILYLGFGMLEWIEQPKETGPASETASSPLLLVPVALSHDGLQAPFFLRRAEEDLSVNPALSYKLQNDFGLELPSIESFEEDQVELFFDNLRKTIGERDGWTVSPKVVLSVFSFHKEVMYQDLKKNESLIADHPVVRSLALGHRQTSPLGFSEIPEQELDELHPPEAVLTILSADASQRRCLAAAKDGHSFVIEGPPGTGKSQTIANLIADALGRNQTVLFVSEKAAALEVVESRLSRASLGEFILELHSHKATRKQVAQSLGSALGTRINSRPGMAAVELQQLAATRRALTAYANAMHEIREPLGKSVHQILGELVGLQDLPQPPQADGVNRLADAADIAEVMTWASRLSHAWGPVTRADDFLWRLAHPSADQARRADLLDRLSEGSSLAASVSEAIGEAVRASGIQRPCDLASAEFFKTLIEALTSTGGFDLQWQLTRDVNVEEAERRANELADLVEDWRKDATWIREHVGRHWEQLSLGGRRLLEEPSEILRSGPLAGALAGVLQPSAATETAAKIGRLIAAIERVVTSTAVLSTHFGRTPPASLAGMRRLQRLAMFANESSKPEALWFSPGAAAAAAAALDILHPIAESWKDAHLRVTKLFDDSVLDLDVEGLELRFREVHKGIGKIRLAYWQDCRRLRSACKAGKVRSEEITGLRDVVAFRRIEKEFVEAEVRHRSELGSVYYRSRATDFERIRRAVRLAQDVIEHASGEVPSEKLVRCFAIQGDEAAETARLGRQLLVDLDSLAAAIDSIGAGLGALVDTVGVTELVSLLNEARDAFENLGREWGAVADAADAGLLSREAAAEALGRRRALHERGASIAASLDADRAMLGPDYVGLQTDFLNLIRALVWGESVRNTLGGAVDEQSARRLVALDVSNFSALPKLATDWVAYVRRLVDEFDVSWRPRIEAELVGGVEDAKATLVELASSIDDVVEWEAHVRASKNLQLRGLGRVVQFCILQATPAAEVPKIIKRSVLDTWLESVSSEDSRLADYRSADREQLVNSFRELDRRSVDLSAAQVIQACNSKRPTTLGGASSVIAAEANKQRKHMPTRKLFELAAAAVQALKPCMMMSPLTVSQFLPPAMVFDLVVFDEASQVRPADAINCIYRGKQVVIAGDQKQLPPTVFFDRIGEDSGDEWEEDQLDDYQSVLDVAKGSGGIVAIPLRWHYRSRHEDLITYSNYSFYRPPGLITFPGARSTGPDLGLEMFFVPGVYRRGGARDNPVEAQKVVERIAFHLKEHPALSIGVVAFSEAQASAIENEVERRMSSNPDLRVMLSSDRLAGGFIKNLESVQGDERDIIIFSVGYGRDEAGKLTMNFGPLNKPGGERRLNVAITRARQRVEVIASIRSADFDPAVVNEGVRHLRRYLDFAEKADNRLGALSQELGPSGLDAESPFEEEVAGFIRSMGFDVELQVGCADYRIDMAVRHPEQPGRYILGVECDGAMYHSSRVARDRDRLRQEILCGLGWTHLHRIWGLSWYRNRGAEEARLRGSLVKALQGADPLQIPSGAGLGAERQEFEMSEFPDWAVPYTPTALVSPRSGLEMHDGQALPELIRMIQQVVDHEGPIAKDLALKRVRVAWGISRAGGRVREAFDAAVRQMHRSRKIVSRPDGFLQRPDQTDVVVRRGWQDDVNSIRTIDEIPKEELRAAIVAFVRDVHSISEDELTSRIAALFGWSRRGPDIVQKFRQVLRSLIESNALRRGSAGLELGVR